MAKRTLLITFPPISQTTEHGDGVIIHWTGHRTHAGRPFQWACASVEGTRPPGKRMVKYLREEER